MSYRPRFNRAGPRPVQRPAQSPARRLCGLAAHLTRLANEPWDAWPVQPGDGEPEFRETLFGDHGLLSFRVDDETETLIIFSIL